MLDYCYAPTVVWLIGTEYLTAQVLGVPRPVFLVGLIVLKVASIKLATRTNLA